MPNSPRKNDKSAQKKFQENNKEKYKALNQLNQLCRSPAKTYNKNKLTQRQCY